MPRRRTTPLKLESKGDMKQLKELMKESPVVILVVFANWCGHCQTMKKNVWDPMCKRKRVNANNIAAVESSVLESDAGEGKKILDKVEGFPTVLQVVNGQITKSFPPPQRPEDLEKIVKTAEQESQTLGAPGSTPYPKTVPAANNNSSSMENEIETPFTQRTNNASSSLNFETNSPFTQRVNVEQEPIFTPSINMEEEPPYTQRANAEQASSLFTPEATSYTPENMSTQEKKNSFTGGGNLYKTMRNISAGILPVDMLHGGAVRKAKKSRKIRKHKKATRKIHRRRSH